MTAAPEPAGIGLGVSADDAEVPTTGDSASTRIERLQQEFDEVRRAVRRLSSALIAVSPLLETPYADAPEWTPWTRYVAPEIKRVRSLLGMDAPWMPVPTDHTSALTSGPGLSADRPTTPSPS